MNALQNVSGQSAPESTGRQYHPASSQRQNGELPVSADTVDRPGFDRPGFSDRSPIELPQISHQGRVLSASGSISSEFRQSSQASIEIYTQDGDRVEINYSALINSAENKSYAYNESRSSIAYSSYDKTSVAFQFTVQGELDAGEQKAIDSLLTEIEDIASQFFSGDVQAAFNAALELGFDSTELKSLSVDMLQKTSVKIETYQYVEQISNPAQSMPAPTAAIDILSQLEQLIEQAKESAMIDKPEKFIKSMLNDMLEMLEQETKSPMLPFIKELIDLR